MPHLVAAPDKFRGTASAPQVAAAAAAAARAVGWTVDEAPMADGGEGTLEVVGGERHQTTVTGPLGQPVSARWNMRTAGPGDAGPTAVIEMAQAAGRMLVPEPSGDDPVRATTAGVGELVVAAVAAGARRIVVAVGGSVTTDGGWGAVQAIGSRRRLEGIDLVVACDVQTTFTDAASVFGPQKGATPHQVDVLTRRLVELADRYRDDLGVDVDHIPGAGAAGGLAGGLAALGARLVPGFDLIAELVDLPHRLERADAVVTGEGHLDLPSLDGKVVGSLAGAVAGRAPLLCVVGAADAGAAGRLTAGPGDIEVVDLSRRFGEERSRSDTVRLVAEVVTEWLARHRPRG